MREKQNNWQRIEAVIKWANMSTNYFARYIGLARGENLYQIKRGNNGISLNVADRIVSKFPQIDKLWLLTGTPCPNSPLDAWALTRLVNPNNVPQYFGQWKRQTMMQLSQYKWVPKAGSHELAFQAMQPAIRFKKSECLDLPPVTYENRKCDITAPQLNALKEMKATVR